MRQFTCPKAVTHPSTNRARCRATALIETNALPLHQTANRRVPPTARIQNWRAQGLRLVGWGRADPLNIHRHNVSTPKLVVLHQRVWSQTGAPKLGAHWGFFLKTAGVLDSVRTRPSLHELLCWIWSQLVKRYGIVSLLTYLLTAPRYT